MGDVVELDKLITMLDIPTERVLEAAKESCSDGVVVLGYDENGEFYCASSMSDCGEIIWLFERAKKRLLEEV